MLPHDEAYIQKCGELGKVVYSWLIFSEKSPFMAEDADLRSGKRSPLKGST